MMTAFFVPKSQQKLGETSSSQEERMASMRLFQQPEDLYAAVHHKEYEMSGVRARHKVSTDLVRMALYSTPKKPRSTMQIFSLNIKTRRSYETSVNLPDRRIASSSRLRDAFMRTFETEDSVFEGGPGEKRPLVVLYIVTCATYRSHDIGKS